MSAFEAIRYEVEDGAACVTLNRPDVRNALNVRMRDDLYEVLTIGMRYLGDHVGVEAGLARWLEDGVELRPTVSLAYRY